MRRQGRPATKPGVKALLAALAAGAFVLPAQAAQPVLHPCLVGAVSARCGTVVAPENRALPGGKKISLRVVVLPATGKKVVRDPFVFLAGGPGGAAAAQASALATIFGTVNRHRDIVLVDQRGTGMSNRLVCPEVPPTVDDVETLKEFIAACQRQLRADFTQYGSVAAAEDLELVRKTLGYAKINLYGGSYGATLAQVFLNRHPGSVRSVVLDGGTLLEVPFFEAFAGNGQRALDQLAARCAADRGCAAAYPTWERDLPGLIDRLTAAPVRVVAAGETVTLDGDAVADTVHTLTLSAEGAATVPRIVAHAVAGDYGPIAAAAVSQSDPADVGDRLVMRPSIMCNEPWAAWDAARAVADSAGTYLAHSFPEQAAIQQILCSAFPHRGESPADWKNPTANVPGLAILGSADPQDPIGNIAAVRQTMPRVRIIVAPGLGHTVGQYACPSRLVAQFVERGTASGLDTSCVHRLRLPAFELE